MPYSPHPFRLQRKRTRGFELPYGTVCVTRPGKWGNWFSGPDAVEAYREAWRVILNGERTRFTMTTKVMIGQRVFNASLLGVPAWEEMQALRGELAKLAGRRLACYCPLDRPCHADVLCELANDGTA